MQQAKTSQSFARLPQKIHKFSTAIQRPPSKEFTFILCISAVDFAKSGVKVSVEGNEELLCGAPTVNLSDVTGE
jgi:hypothetical protein